MRTGTLSGASCALAGLLVAACARQGDGAGRLQSYQTAVRVEVGRARACADALRALAHRNAVEIGRALDEVEVPYGNPAWAIGSPATDQARGREAEVLRRVTLREGAMDATAAWIAAEGTVAPATLARAATAVGRAQHIEERLCRARDIAVTLAGMAPPSPPGLAKVASEAVHAR